VKRPRPTSETRRIRNLKEHSWPYVTPSELAEYWQVSRRQIYKYIEQGELRAVRLGPRVVRIQTADAIAFEAQARWSAEDERKEASARKPHKASVRHT
jgi:excisionase family DNA binding protein